MTFGNDQISTTSLPYRQAAVHLITIDIFMKKLAYLDIVFIPLIFRYCLYTSNILISSSYLLYLDIVFIPLIFRYRLRIPLIFRYCLYSSNI